MNKNELANKIRRIDGLTNGEKSALIELLRKQKKYGLVWEDKPEDVEERLREELPVLIEDTGKAIISEEADAPNHILIEGDNLEALTALAYTHEGQIDVIYIDPPYNTGNKDFVYNDQFVDKEDSYRHSKWLSFMSKRLHIAKQLLSDKGVIFISIDDNEQAQLKLLCDEILGENHFLAQLIWKKKQGGGNDSSYIVTEHEYVLCYGQNQTTLGLDKTYTLDDKLYPFSDDKGDFGLVTLDKASIQISNSLIYEIIGPDGKKYFPRIVKGKQSCWRWSKEKVKKQYDELVFKNGKVYTKYYRPKGVTPRSLLYDAKYGRTESGNDDIKAIFDSKPFGYPKPVLLIKHLISICTNEHKTILDFFAGSGTTLHATMQLNAEDGGHRQCILVTNNENNICEEVTYKRNKRVIQGYTTPKGEEVPGLTGNTLRYYKTDFISRDRTPRNMRALVAASTDLLCIKNDIYREAKLVGRNINPKIVRYFVEGDRSMLVIYDERVISAIAEILETVEPGKEKIKVYVFSAGSYAYDDEFEEVADKVELCALPDAIYQAYQKVLPKRRPKFLPEAIEEARQSKADENGIFHFTDGEAEV
ncbi:site-specific DNA-methyltransferase [Coprobacter fastidiosus]|uniref:site-specific DNA-methyltransferase n=1 Tax=Coprobacter fastidiosus TaxID=1099853 RepID=UPI002676015F|nr:site-specific DNA-methyltransferase [Coprobacter fastidiosus]